jgi:hypothetical protein
MPSMSATRRLSGLGATTAALVLLFAVSTCHGGFTAPCSQGWVKTERKLDPNEPSDLSECQALLLGDLPTNNILLGGKGVTHCIPLTCVSNALPFDITHGTLSTQAIHPYSMTLNLAMVRMVAQIQQNAWRPARPCAA